MSVSAAASHRLVTSDGLPHPATGMSISELSDRQDDALEILTDGGAIVLHSDDGEQLFGVLTRNTQLVGDATLAAMIDAGTVPPLDQLLEMDDRGELPFGPYRDWQPHSHGTSRPGEQS